MRGIGPGATELYFNAPTAENPNLAAKQHFLALSPHLQQNKGKERENDRGHKKGADALSGHHDLKCKNGHA